MERIQPLVGVGDKIKVEWPMEDGTTENTKAKVVQVEKSSKVKNGSWFKYTLKLKKFPEVQTTRLNNLRWELLASKKTNHTSANNNHDNTMVDIPRSLTAHSTSAKRRTIPSHERILAPMVGGSELAFRLLCRRYGADLAYTPMMNSERFVVDEQYRKDEFQSTPDDRPLVAHFSGTLEETSRKIP